MTEASGFRGSGLRFVVLFCGAHGNEGLLSFAPGEQIWPLDYELRVHGLAVRV